jgi:CAAX prenyl protease-like protein
MMGISSRNGKTRLVLAYVAPFVLYLLLTSLAARFDRAYPAAYGIAIAVVGIATILLLRGRRILKPHRRIFVPVLVGLVGFLLWVALATPQFERALTSGFPDWLRPSPRAGYDPFSELEPQAVAIAFVTVRLIGLVILTPIAEELFWRGFLLRWVDSPDWEDVPLGTFRVRSFVVVTIFFVAVHPEWFAAAAYCMLLNGLMYWKKDLWSCVVAHAASNLALAVYIMATGTWWLW